MDKERAITRAIEAAVGAFIADDMDLADHFFEMAEEFHRTPQIYFAPNNYNTNTIITKGAQ